MSELNGTYYANFWDVIHIVDNEIFFYTDDGIRYNQESIYSIDHYCDYKAKGRFTISDDNLICIKSDPIEPLKEIHYYNTVSKCDSSKLILKFPNYNFSATCFPIVLGSNYRYPIIEIWNGRDCDFQKTEIDKNRMIIECKSDSVVIDFPTNMNTGVLNIRLTQSLYINNTTIRSYLGIVSFSGFIDICSEESVTYDHVIVFPNVTNKIFDMWYLEDVLVRVCDDKLYFFNEVYKKISSEIIYSRKEIRDLYEHMMSKNCGNENSGR